MDFGPASVAEIFHKRWPKGSINVDLRKTDTFDIGFGGGISENPGLQIPIFLIASIENGERMPHPLGLIESLAQEGQ